ncbi:hypothetical protein IKF20_00410 [Candidatus Saccharibacteria bacterium]|nr:hypothetical protein [Candidatus Saccharibacteria bacterium]
MKSKLVLLSTAIFALSLSVGLAGSVRADEEKGEEEKTSETTETNSSGTNISLTPVSKVLEISPSSKYEDSFEVKNDGDKNIDIEVYAAPYSYVYSEEADAYQLGFSNENSFTQITRWITFKDAGGKWDKKPTFTIKAKESITVNYRVSTPDSIPAGGQYAVLFAHTLTSVTSANGIKTEASPGLVVYGHSTEGELDRSHEVKDMKIEQNINENGTTRSGIFASAKVKNNGNVDFGAKGILKVESILGGSSYETENGGVHISVIPETELSISDEWKDAPGFGIYKATWSVSVNGEEPQIIEQIIFINPLPLVFFTIILLTIIIICAIIFVRKRKERRSRLAA